MRLPCGVKLLCGLALVMALFTPSFAAQTQELKFTSGLICDTQGQAERFVSLLADNVEKAIGTVNVEAGQPNACMVATFGFIPGQAVSEMQRNGAILNVIEVVVMAVATTSGLQLIEPKTFYSVVPTGERIA